MSAQTENKTQDDVTKAQLDAEETDHLYEPSAKKSKSREQNTIHLVECFKEKMREASKKLSKKLDNNAFENSPHRNKEYEDVDEQELDQLKRADSIEWMCHKFEPDEDEELRLADDVYTKDERSFTNTPDKSTKHQRSIESSPKHHSRSSNHKSKESGSHRDCNKSRKHQGHRHHEERLNRSHNHHKSSGHHHRHRDYSRERSSSQSRSHRHDSKSRHRR